MMCWRICAKPEAIVLLNLTRPDFETLSQHSGYVTSNGLFTFAVIVGFADDSRATERLESSSH